MAENIEVEKNGNDRIRIYRFSEIDFVFVCFITANNSQYMFKPKMLLNYRRKYTMSQHRSLYRITG